jgi:hypothetical protein
MLRSTEMEESLDFSAIQFADRLRPRVPRGDDLDAASAVANDVLACTGELQDDLQLIANRHIGTAPMSSVHVLDLSAAVARVVIDWITEWPA